MTVLFNNVKYFFPLLENAMHLSRVCLRCRKHVYVLDYNLGECFLYQILQQCLHSNRQLSLLIKSTIACNCVKFV